ncbi:MAG: serine/threonine protein kinase [Scytonematopsis contorta HA4267-MV1]|jgi:serine/threonine protein kinase|nr:serine/threonine protein kinase [Scytonematopsis contorta HA4267-MV1]
MPWCLNPDCANPQNPDGIKFCQNCGTELIPLLRGHYRVVNVLSTEGGFGRTYLAEDIDKLDEKCVVKQFAPKLQGTSGLKKAIELFQEEAKRLQQLGEHRQIPQLFAYFEEENNLYLVQEYIDGQNLSQELKSQSRYSESKIRQFLIDLLPVLKFIHECDVIHRDIKPQNIIRRHSDQRLFLIDFGASKQLTATVHNSIGTTIGSHGYSPIEQMQGGEAYPASDLFSLGATCFHLLTGVVPYQLWMHQGYSWVSSWQKYLQEPVSSKLVEILNKLLQIDYHQRYQSADEVIKDLAPQPAVGIAATSTLLIPPPTPSTPSSVAKAQLPQAVPATRIPRIQIPPTQPPVSQTQRQKHRHLLLLGAVVALLGLGGIIYLQYNLFANNNNSKKTDINPTSIPNNTPLITTGINQTQNNQSNQENTYTAQVLKKHSSAVNSVAINTNNTMLASGSGDKSIKIWNLGTGEVVRTLEGHSDWVWSVAFSPESQILASSSRDKRIILWDIATGKKIRILQGHTDGVPSIAISRDGKALVSGSRDNTIKIWELQTGQQVKTLKGHIDSINSVAISPDNTTIVSGGSDKTVKLWNPVTGEVIKTLKGHKAAVVSVAISPDGKTLASASVDKNVKLWDMTTGKEIHTFVGHSEAVVSVAFRPDGKVLASGSFDGTIKLWNLETKQAITTLKQDSAYVYSVRFSPDGKTLASGRADTSINIWNLSQ